MKPSTRAMPGLPWRGRLANLLGSVRGLVREEGYFDRDRMIEFAHLDTGLEDFGQEFDPTMIELLIDSAKEANLTFLGRRSFFYGLGTSLAVRLLYIETRKRHPEIFERPLLPPLIITGPPRSGTTLLQNLLSLHPDFDAIPNWELARPVPPALLGNSAPDRRLELAEAWDVTSAKYAPKGDHIHFRRATTPGECIVLMLPTLRSYAFLSIAPLYPFMDELMRSDGRILYAEYVELLKLLQHARPGRRMLLKAPAHAPYIDRILELMPNASIVATSRDLVTTTTSLLSLNMSGFSRSVKHYDVGAHSRKMLDLVEFGIDRYLEARTGNEDSIHEVSYPELVADPVAVVRRVYERFGVEWPEGHERRLEAYLDANPKGKHGGHRYVPSDFGLSEDEIRERVAPWNDRFAKPPPDQPGHPNASRTRSEG